MTGVKGKSGPPGHTHSRGNRGGNGGPVSNSNATKHGLHGYLALGKMPKGAAYIRRMLTAFKAALDAAVVERHGELTLYRASLVQTACRHEGRAQLLTRYLRVMEADAADGKGKPVALADRLAVLKEIGAASDARDRCLKLLGIDAAADTANLWAALDAQRQPFIDPYAASPSNGLADGKAPSSPPDASAAETDQDTGQAAQTRELAPEKPTQDASE